MPLIVIKGFGDQGDGTNSTLSITHGLGGIEDVPTALTAYAIDAYTVQIQFDEPPIRAVAEDPSNYSINDGLEVTSVDYYTDFVYRIKTTRQTRAHLYTLLIDF